jgi:xanthine/uracil permease
MVTLQNFANTLSIGSIAIPGLVAVSLLGIILNLVLNWQVIVTEARQPAAKTTDQPLPGVTL